jgi:hypothetical protein
MMLVAGVPMRSKLLLVPLAGLMLVAGCASGPERPAPNSALATFSPADNAVRVMVSDLQPATGAELVAPDGTRYASAGLAVVDQPHTTYNPPPTVSFGIGGFGFGGHTAVGSGVGVGMPVGGPTVAGTSDQYVTSTLIPVPADYRANWQGYTVRVQLGNNRVTTLAAPPPAAS